MSLKAMQFAWDHYPGGGGILLLVLALADWARDDGSNIWPSIATIAHKTRQSRRAVQYQMKTLREQGWLIMTSDQNPRLNQKTPTYRIPIYEIAQRLGVGAQNLHPYEEGEGCKIVQKGVSPVAPKPLLLQPSLKPYAQAVGFARFWEAYPKKKSKGKAEQWWIRHKPDEALVATILESLERVKRTHDWKKDGGQFIPYPATWLNAKGWEDEVAADAPLATPCGWPGCRHRGIKLRGTKQVCEPHFAALERGETP